MSNNPNIQILELAAHELTSILDEFVLVGGCAVGLLITDQGRPPVRHTIDVDLVTEITPLSNYYLLSNKLKNLGFQESKDLICRWIKNGLVVDILSTDAKILGFTNSWYPLAVQMSVTTKLPSGHIIRHISAPLMIATKLESFYQRGGGDFLHHDIEDIITLVDGRPDVVNEIRGSPTDLRIYIEHEIDDLLGNIQFMDSLPKQLYSDMAEQARLPILIERLRKIAGL